MAGVAGWDAPDDDVPDDEGLLFSARPTPPVDDIEEDIVVTEATPSPVPQPPHGNSKQKKNKIK